MRHPEAGYTLLELLLAITLTTMMVLIAGNFVAKNINETNRYYNQTVVQSNTKSAVSSIARVIEEAKSVESQNSLPDPNGPSGNSYGWSGSAGTNATLILAVPSRDTSGNLLYVDGLHTNLYTDDIIYYLDSATHQLYRRTIANPVSGNAAITTCPPSHASSSCPADATIINNVATLTTQYLDQSNQTVTVPSGTEAVAYSVTQTVTLGARVVQSTYSTTTSLRNR